jgi:hypothetical protein
VRFDRAAVQSDQPLREREADAQAPRRAVQRAVGLREQVEDLRQKRFIDPHAIVAHAHLGMVLLASVFAPNLDAAFRVRVLGGVVEQVDEDLFQPRGVGTGPNGFGAHVHKQFVPPLLDQRLSGFERVPDDLV